MTFPGKVSILVFLMVVLLAANSSAAMLILPQDAQPLLGVSVGTAQTASRLSVSSTDPVFDGQRYRFEDTAAQIGGIVGLQAWNTQFYLGYDYLQAQDLTQQRLLFNLDYHFVESSLRPWLGVAAGSVENRITVDGTDLTVSVPTLGVHTGIELWSDEKSSLGIQLEYAYSPSSRASHRYDEAHFTSYTLERQHSYLLRVDYRFLFP